MRNGQSLGQLKNVFANNTSHFSVLRAIWRFVNGNSRLKPQILAIKSKKYKKTCKQAPNGDWSEI
jgi:hypothetical protein